MKYFYVLLILFFLTTACKNDKKKPTKDSSTQSTEQATSLPKLHLETNQNGVDLLNQVVDKASAKKLEAATITFTLNDKSYQIDRDCGQFELKEMNLNEKGQITMNRLNNMGFKRIENKQNRSISETKRDSLIAALKQIAFFAELPFGLNASSVRKQYQGEETIDGKTYARIKLAYVERIARDYRTKQLILWVNKKKKTIDYIAYYKGEDHAQMRFKKARQDRKIEGLRFVNYINYQPDSDSSIDLEDMGKAFDAHHLKEIGYDKYIQIDVKIRERDCG